MKILYYDTQKYPFRDLLETIYKTDLTSLDTDDAKKNLTLGNDTKTSLHKDFYRKIDSGWPEFMDMYKSFVSNVIHPIFEDDILIYQKTPGIRFCRPGAKAVYKWHSDGDKDHKHPLGEINVFLPLTKCFDTNSVWFETIPGMGDWRSLEMDYGQFFIGYWNQCRHGNKENSTGKTRVSFDFRVIPGFAYDESYELQTCTTKLKFIIGSYYEKVTRDKTPSMYDPIENAKLGAAC